MFFIYVCLYVLCIPMLPMMFFFALSFTSSLKDLTNQIWLRLGCWMVVVYPTNSNPRKSAFSLKIQHAGKLHQDGVQSWTFPKFNSKRFENWWLEDDPFLLGLVTFQEGAVKLQEGISSCFFLHKDEPLKFQFYEAYRLQSPTTKESRLLKAVIGVLIAMLETWGNRFLDRKSKPFMLGSYINSCT